MSSFVEIGQAFSEMSCGVKNSHFSITLTIGSYHSWCYHARSATGEEIKRGQRTSCGLRPQFHVSCWFVHPFDAIHSSVWPLTNWSTSNNNNNNQRQCLWCCPHDRGHCESSPGLFDECRLSAGWPPTLRPSQPTWAMSPPINSATIHIHHCHLLLLLSPKADTRFTVPRRVEGWVDLCTARRVCSPCPRLYIAVAVVINITGRGLSHRSQSCHH